MSKRRQGRGASRRQPQITRAARSSVAAEQTEQAGLFSRLLTYQRTGWRSAWNRIQRTPMATAMTILVIGISLSLPLAMHLFVKNLQVISGDLSSSAQITIFLTPGLAEMEALSLQEKLLRKDETDKVHYISPDQALAEFRSLSGFDEVLDQMPENPMPAMLVVLPTFAYSDNPVRLDQLVLDLKALPQADRIEVDSLWMQRLQSGVSLISKAAWVITVFLLAGVLLVVGNTIRLLSQNFRDEIEVSSLVGATRAYLRRPFVYTGIFFGAVGALVAWVVVSSAILLLLPQLEDLNQSYGGQFALQSLGFIEVLVLFLAGTLLGYGGARFAVGRFIRQSSL